MNRLLGVLAAVLWAAPALADFEAAAEYSAGYRGISLLVIQDGEIVFEDYPNGGSADTANALASGTKSFAGILAAAAVQDGLLNLDERVSDTITEWQGTRRETITVRQLLSLTDGLRVPQQADRIPGYQVAIRTALDREPGSSFAYNSVPFQVFGEIMRRKLDGDPVAYLTRRVFDPIGLEVSNWRRDRGGNPTFATGAHLTARNWARLGEFILAHGEWNGEQLVSRQAFDELFIGSDVNPAYGLSWWLINPVDFRFAATTEPLNDSTDFWQHVDVFPEDMVMAAGAGDQRLFISWERNIVVVRQAEGILGAILGHRLSWSDVQFWRLLEAAPGERPAPLPPIMMPNADGSSRGTAITLPSGAVVVLPPVAEEGDEEEDGDDSGSEEEDVFGPTF